MYASTLKRNLLVIGLVCIFTNIGNAKSTCKPCTEPIKPECLNECPVYNSPAVFVPANYFSAKMMKSLRTMNDGYYFTVSNQWIMKRPEKFELKDFVIDEMKIKKEGSRVQLVPVQTSSQAVTSIFSHIQLFNFAKSLGKQTAVYCDKSFDDEWLKSKFTSYRKAVKTDLQQATKADVLYIPGNCYGPPSNIVKKLSKSGKIVFSEYPAEFEAGRSNLTVYPASATFSSGSTLVDISLAFSGNKKDQKQIIHFFNSSLQNRPKK